MFKHIGIALLGVASAAFATSMSSMSPAGTSGMSLDRVPLRVKRGKGEGKKGRNWDRPGRFSLAQTDRFGAPHLHARERARHRFPPGPERRAFIAAQTGRGAR